MSRAIVLLALLSLAGASHAQRARYRLLRVERVSPAPNARAVSATASIAVHFDQAPDFSRSSPSDLSVSGRWSGVARGSYSVESGGRVLRFTPNSPFSAGELVTVTLTNGFRTEFGSRIGRGVVWNFWVESRSGTRSFTRAATYVPGSIPYGGYGGDIDEDGDLDLCVPNEGTADVSIFLNNGLGFDPPTTVGVGRRASANEGLDLDRDGHLDLVVANVDDGDVSVLLGGGDGTFAPQVRYPVGSAPRGLAVFDTNGDGDMDVFTANLMSSDLSVLSNRGDGTLLSERRFSGGVAGEKSLAAADMNLDGVVDLVVVGLSDGNARTLLGDGRGHFRQLPATPVGAGPWTVVTGDVDGDGRNDAAVSLGNGSAAVICRNTGSGFLSAPVSYATGFFPVAVDLGDLDGDGWLDLTATSFGGATYHVWFNQADGTFGDELPLPASLAGSCTVLFDLDGDGDLDIVGIDEVADEVHVFVQDG